VDCAKVNTANVVVNILKKLALITVALGGVSIANANQITIDFNDATPGFGITEPYIEDGFRISAVTCHYDIVGGDSFNLNGSLWMGFDGSGCLGEIPTLRLDRFGSAFSLVSIDIGFGWWGQIVSSSGGLITNADNQSTLNISGAEWQDIEWVEFINLEDMGTPNTGFDNIKLVGVPEPGTLGLLGIGLLGTGFARRRKIV